MGNLLTHSYFAALLSTSDHKDFKQETETELQADVIIVCLPCISLSRASRRPEELGSFSTAVIESSRMS